MFTITQIQDAHSKVRSGADFPTYIQDLKSLGVRFYETYVSDGHSDYFGEDDNKVSSQAKYDHLVVEHMSDVEQFTKDLRAHQSGQTDYPTFCKDCAKSGIEKWVVTIHDMKCTYFDKKGYKLLIENIPG